MNRLESDQLLSNALVKSSMLRVEDATAAAAERAEAQAAVAAAEAAPAMRPVPRPSIDAGATTQIRLDMGE